jgi:hypothetical protein
LVPILQQAVEQEPVTTAQTHQLVVQAVAVQAIPQQSRIPTALLVTQAHFHPLKVMPVAMVEHLAAAAVELEQVLLAAAAAVPAQLEHREHQRQRVATA